MKMKSILWILLGIFLSNSTCGQQIYNNKYFIFFPNGKHFNPIKANYQEPSLGLQNYLGKSDFKINVGNAIDLVELNYNKMKLSIGAELMGYAFSTSYDQYLFQIDALDGLFAANAVLSYTQNESNKYYLRYRLLHNSAHYVDGYFLAKKESIEKEKIGVFNRNFHEFTLSHEFNDEFYFRTYLSGAFTIHSNTSFNEENIDRSKVRELKALFYNSGFEFVIKDIFENILFRNKNLFINYHFSLDGAEKYFGNNHLMTGIKFGDWLGRGLGVYLSYYTGKDVFNKYFNKKVKRLGAGFFLDF